MIIMYFRINATCLLLCFSIGFYSLIRLTSNFKIYLKVKKQNTNLKTSIIIIFFHLILVYVYK